MKPIDHREFWDDVNHLLRMNFPDYSTDQLGPKIKIVINTLIDHINLNSTNSESKPEDKTA